MLPEMAFHRPFAGTEDWSLWRSRCGMMLREGRMAVQIYAAEDTLQAGVGPLACTPLQSARAPAEACACSLCMARIMIAGCSHVPIHAGMLNLTMRRCVQPTGACCARLTPGILTPGSGS